MNILFASSSFGGGGITSYAKEVITHFSSGNEFSVMIGEDKVSPITIPAVRVWRYECNDLSINNAKAVIDVINNEIKPDVILSSNARIISLVAKYLNNDIKIITVSHSLRYEEADMAAISYKYIDKLVAASSIYNKQYLMKRFCNDGRKIDIILNFVDEYKNADDIRKKKILNNKPCIIVFPGGSSSSKSPDIVMRIALQLVRTNWDFKLFWNGRTLLTSPKLRFLHIEDLKDFISDPRVHFLGRLPTREDAVNLISSAHIFLAPSRREACPMALLEAMRVGTIPMVADFDIANKEIIRDGKNGFVIGHKDIDSWVNRIGDIINNPNKYDEIYYNSYNTFKEELTYEVWKHNMDRVIYNEGLDHVKRINISMIDLMSRILFFKLDLWWCGIEIFFQERLKGLLEWMRIKRLIIKGNHNKRI